MNKPVTILERCLQLWEDRYLIIRSARLVEMSQGEKVEINPDGPLAHFGNFRKYLREEVLEHNPFSDNRFGIRGFSNKDGPSEDYIMGMCAYGLASWVKSSRRVFKVERDLQLLLDSTSIEGITAKEVQFPFSSFLTEFDQSFVSGSGDAYNYALISMEELLDNKMQVMILLFGNDLLEYQALTPMEKAELAKATERKNWDRVGALVRKLQVRQKKTPGAGFSSRIISPDEELEPAFQAMAQSMPDTSNYLISALRSVIGLCLYLKSLPTSSPHVSSWEPVMERVRTVSGKAMSDDALVCSVASSFRLTSEEREAFSEPVGQPTRSFGEKCCHFRRGTWCRPPGSDEDAPRTNWRRPTIVRKDKLKPGELPKGAENILSLR